MKKFLAIVLSAVLFGTVAGGTMLGINALSDGRMITAAAGITNTVKGISDNTEEAALETLADTEESADSLDAVLADYKNIESTKKAGTGLRLDVSDIVEEAMPQVVSITNTMVIKQSGYGSIFDYFYGGGFDQEYEVPASGSGVILKQTDDELLIVTNNHVVEDSKELSVSFIDGTTVNAAIKGTDDTVDLAVIAVKLEDIPEDTMKEIRVSRLHETEDLKPGQGVIAIGNALGFGQTVTVGYISALSREIQAEGSTYSDLIQVDAAINPGNSGGPLLNMDGEVIGINVAKLSNTAVEGVGYSIPIYKVTDVIDHLSNAKTKVEVAEEDQGRLGIYMNTVSQANAQAFGIPAGVIITGFSTEEIEGVNPDNVQASPAEEAGLLKNDIITAFDGQKVSDAQALQQLVKYYEAGTEVEVTVQRLNDGKYEEKVVKVTLGGRNDESIASDEARKAYEKTHPTQAQSDETEDSGKPEIGKKPQDGKKPQSGKNGQPAKPEDGQDQGSNEDEADQGQSQGGRSGMEELYELFREFMDQYR